MPLFTREIIELMRRLIPPERQGCVATAVIVRARKGVGGARPPKEEPTPSARGQGEQER